MNREEVRTFVNEYCKLRDVQFAAYEVYARKHHLSAKELFVLDLIWFSENGCFQSEICDRLSATKQTISAIVRKFQKLGYVSLETSETDRRNKLIRLTDTGREYARRIIQPAADAEIDAMAELCREDILELVRLTTLFSTSMSRRFAQIHEGRSI